MATPLPNYLRTFRKRSGLAQHEVARLLGCAHGATLSRYERGERVPSFATLVVLECIYGARLEDLFRGRARSLVRTLRLRAQRLSRTLADTRRVTPALRRKVEFIGRLGGLPKT